MRETAEETKRDGKLIDEEPLHIEHYKTPRGENVENTYYLAEDIGPSDNKSLDTHPTLFIPFDEVYDKLSYPGLKIVWNSIKDKVEAYFNKEDYKYVVDNSKYVKVDESKINDFIKDLGTIKYTHWSNNYKLDLNEKEWILLAFIIESMNFCFWRKPKWKYNYKGELITGSNALLDAIINEVETNKEFLDINYLKKLTKDKFNKIFDGVGECPLLDERYSNFKEIINIFSTKDVYKDIHEIKSDLDLLKYITNNFKCFDDKSEYKGRIIHFNKRATLLTNDLFYLSKTINKNIKNVNNLGGCADYGIPRTFRDYKILNYNKELAKMIDNEEEIEHDSDMEIEIRGSMLYIIERIKEKLKEKNIVINSVELDSLIWWMGKRLKDRSNSHHTITIYY